MPNQQYPSPSPNTSAPLSIYILAATKAAPPNSAAAPIAPVGYAAPAELDALLAAPVAEPDAELSLLLADEAIADAWDEAEDCWEARALESELDAERAALEMDEATEAGTDEELDMELAPAASEAEDVTVETTWAVLVTVAVWA